MRTDFFIVTIIQYIMTALFVVIFLMIIFRYFRSLRAPILTEKARVVAKRIGRYDRFNTILLASRNLTRMRYYIIFENEEGKRFEFLVNKAFYEGIVEGDIGYVTYQGEWLKDFQRFN